MTPEEVPGILLLMALAGEERRQIEALEWTARERPEFLKWMGYWQHGGGWKIWPRFSFEIATDGSVQPIYGDCYKAWTNWCDLGPIRKIKESKHEKYEI